MEVSGIVLIVLAWGNRTFFINYRLLASNKCVKFNRWKSIYAIYFSRYKEFPNDEEEDTLQKRFGIRLSELQDGHLGDEAIDIIQAEFGTDAKLTKRRGSAFNGI